jgi:hypothetical protein
LRSFDCSLQAPEGNRSRARDRATLNVKQLADEHAVKVAHRLHLLQFCVRQSDIEGGFDGPDEVNIFKIGIGTKERWSVDHGV